MWESHKETGEELTKVGWICEKNGRGTVDNWRVGEEDEWDGRTV